MALKKLKKAFKDMTFAADAIMKGIQDYNKLDESIGREAEKAVGESGSREQDVKNQINLEHKLKKERGVSIRNSIKKRLNG